MTPHFSLHQLGWKPFFQLQLSLEELENSIPARVFGVERSLIYLLSSEGSLTIPVIKSMPDLAVGDWVVVDTEHRFIRLLERMSLFSRKASGTQVYRQLISANVDTLLIVSSLNNDFNLNRIERYLALAHEAKVEPIVLLTKADLCENPEPFVEAVQALDKMLPVFAVNAQDQASLQALDLWLSPGQTLAFLGSSGVGKSTLVNTLLGGALQETNAIREADSRGRHTTTSRSLHLTPSGVLLLDTPGMRELQLADCAQGVDETFADISALAMQCKFSDCQHESEPGCAVQAAIQSGKLDQRRLLNYRKLMKEQAFNAGTLAEKRAEDKRFSKMVKSAKNIKQRKT
ncbi:ribosome small subunit-dependent GTPase A [Thiomicrorhabdus heinhorstiae]|uniref:Small ribosomal subunit biogenesis GTPase RsgA n=1 Tax=Thiomicrorhabdus heinhorstiae TaxID=2748010 RepID=A0ABS0BUH9_9GAMM|nr:ribosome small subunit-dependent GTPase A [Thiomicrorhabdus heinhorstiae]MBF6057493.1 ribosome small subunit-dependent GTPase A [Thiomicrorhabdus heinhorstiae]